ncbi:DUF2304 domain-containing protein [Gorillibacterium massiliense]|uniref:DUF2304 domain-containing protein n=1 Tax=Gorillibacterium massiliense TaxID=1280390 RepID=UPI0004ADD1B7|nr:DUF2304 domain-containing protein [Gorillibacterium massiliense]
MNIYLVAFLFCLGFLLVTIELIRRKKISERYSLLWLLLGLVMLILSLAPELLDGISKALGIVYGTSLLFFIGFLFSLVFIMHLTIVITRMDRKLTRLTQEMALLKARMHEEDTDDRPVDRSL